MKPDIVTKLQAQLTHRVSSEMQVVYVLVETRKLLELASRAGSGDIDNEYYALKFYCDWAIHARLDHVGAQRIVERFDKFQRWMDEQDSKQQDRTTTDVAFLNELDTTLRLRNFRSQLGRFLGAHGVDDSVTTDEDRWSGFLAHYSRVIEDAPLVSAANGLEFVDTVTVKVLDQRPTEAASGHTLVLTWTWVSNKTGVAGNIVRFY